VAVLDAFSRFESAILPEAPAVDPTTQQSIKSTLSENPIVLFMKGTRNAPRCGFSAKVVQILDSLVDDYVTVDVLSDPAVRDGIKEYSAWPTIPQLYVKGEFVGGCDIVTELFDSGELQAKLGGSSEPPPTPTVTVSESAAKALSAALENPQEFVRLEVNAGFDHDLSVGPKQAGDIEIGVSGLTLLVDRASARRIDGVRIDAIETDDGLAFKIDNPNEPPRVRPVSPSELRAKLAQSTPPRVIDVRTKDEWAIAHIAGTRLYDDALAQELESADRDTELVFVCHYGTRSQQAAEHFLGKGFRKVNNLAGGIDAWTREVDPSLARY
jgi:monothiol glutaredoxin